MIMNLLLIVIILIILLKNILVKKLVKKYNSFAYTTIIKHEKILNNTASTNFYKKRSFSFFTNF